MERMSLFDARVRLVEPSQPPKADGLYQTLCPIDPTDQSEDAPNRTSSRRASGRGKGANTWRWRAIWGGFFDIL